MKKFDNQVTPISSTEITWNGKTGVAEWSAVKNRVTRLWNDSIDVGFIIKSARTGKEVLFTYMRTTHDVGYHREISFIYRSDCGNFIIELLND